MSTDYGFVCSCGSIKILHNVRYGQLDELKSIIANVDSLIEVVSAGLEVKRESLTYDSTINDEILFVYKHRGMGHIVSVGDEYGRRHDQCHEVVDCQSCGHRWTCQLTEKHEGEHTATDGLTKSS